MKRERQSKMNPLSNDAGLSRIASTALFSSFLILMGDPRLSLTQKITSIRGGAIMLLDPDFLPAHLFGVCGNVNLLKFTCFGFSHCFTSIITSSVIATGSGETNDASLLLDFVVSWSRCEGSPKIISLI